MTSATRSPVKKANKKAPPRATAPPEASNAKRGLMIGAALLVTAVIVALIVSLASGGDEPTEGVGAAEAARIPTGSLRQVSFAAIEGAALPRYDSAQAADPAVGMEAPAITASYYDNAEVTLRPGDGTPRVMVFLAHWCPHCQAEVKSLHEWFAVNGTPDDVEVVAISTSVDEGSPNYPPSAWFLREEWPVPVLRDSAQSDLAAGYGLSGFPFMVVVDGDGEVLARTSGGLTHAQWERTLDLAREG